MEFGIFDLEDNKESEKTQFHGGFHKLDRLNAILKKINEYKITPPNETLKEQTARLSIVLGLLNDFMCELIPHMKEEERNNSINTYRKVIADYDKFVPLTKMKTPVKIPRSLLYSIDDLEMSLRVIQHNKGMDLPKKSGIFEEMNL